MPGRVPAEIVFNELKMLAAALALVLQQADPVQRQLDEILRLAQDQAAAQLIALGSAALVPISERLAADLRDGMASPAAEPLLAALLGHPEALGPLQAAFRDTATSPAGRVELAGALVRLMDSMSWRPGLRALLGDPSAPWIDRLHAAALLHDAGEPDLGPALERLAAESESRSVDDQAALAALLDAFAPRARPAPRLEEPRVSVVDEDPAPPRRPLVKKRETGGEDSLSMPGVAAATAALGLLVLLLILRRRSP
jgi:hypothetical protein